MVDVGILLSKIKINRKLVTKKLILFEVVDCKTGDPEGNLAVSYNRNRTEILQGKYNIEAFLLSMDASMESREKACDYFKPEVDRFISEYFDNNSSLIF